MPTRVLFVCLGNICRSPAAEGIFQHLVKEKGLQDEFIIDSAGTGGWHVGALPDSRMRAAAKARGISLTSRARQFVTEDFQRFDYILAMDESNFMNIMALKPTGKSPLAKVELMLNHHGNTPLKNVPDPYYGGSQGFEEVLDLLEVACDNLLQKIGKPA